MAIAVPLRHARFPDVVGEKRDDLVVALPVGLWGAVVGDALGVPVEFTSRKERKRDLAHSHDAIVLGAWGCGAFGNSGDEIASLFHRTFTENFSGAYRDVVFAIVDWSAGRQFIGPFEAAFGGPLTRNYLGRTLSSRPPPLLLTRATVFMVISLLSRGRLPVGP